MGASKEVESLAARLEDFPGFDEMRAGSAAGSSCGETPMKDGGGRGPPDIVVASDLVRSESDDVSDFQDATLVEIMRERIQELERENVALRWRERTAEARIEAEIQEWGAQEESAHFRSHRTTPQDWGVAGPEEPEAEPEPADPKKR